MTPSPETLHARLEAVTRGTITFLDGGRVETLEWTRLHDEARAMAAALQAREVAPGDHVALLGPTSRPLVTAIEATWLAGAAAVVLPLPMRLGSLEEFVSQTRARLRSARVALLVADPDLAAFLEPAPGDPPAVLLPDLVGEAAHLAPAAYERPPDDPDALAILQFTSGSTAEPKAVMLPHRCVTANLDAIAEAALLDVAGDRIVSWLPLYHDMGLIGLFGLPATTGTDLVLAGPQEFLTAPRRWMEWMSAFAATATAGPNFAYALAARSLRRGERLDLSRWRVALNGAEPIDPAAVEAFCDAGRRHGLSPRAVLAAFGMAEATLAVTFSELGAGLVVDTVDRRALETEGVAAPTGADEPKARRLAVLGRPLRGLEVRIVDPATARLCGDREVGEVQIQGSSVTTGYFGNPSATAAAFNGPWLRTGDLGYLRDGELVVCGRLKDVIIVGGRNVFPEDAERAAATVDGVRAGNVIAFGTPGPRGREAVVVVAEARLEAVGLETGELDPAALTRLRDEVARRVRDATGVPAREVVLVRPGTLPKTSSGKLQRSLCRRRYEADALDVLA